MKKFLSAARVAALFVGSVVGAGFATGQEIVLFFGGGSPLNLLLAAAFMAFMCFVFMEVGLPTGRALRVTESIVAAASFVVYGAMIAAAEEVLFSFFGLRGLSLFLAVGSAALTFRDLSHLSKLNLVAVPMMVLLVILVGARSGMNFGGDVRLFSSIAYGAMNLLFSGILMAGEGGALSRGERVLASVMVGAVVFLLLLFMHLSVDGLGGSMPFLAAAESAGRGVIVPITLLLAIITTLTSCNYLVTREMVVLLHDPFLAASVVLLGGVLFATLGFTDIVTYLYPAVSYLGLILTIAVIICFWRMKRAQT